MEAIQDDLFQLMNFWTLKSLMKNPVQLDILLYLLGLHYWWLLKCLSPFWFLQKKEGKSMKPKLLPNTTSNALQIHRIAYLLYMHLHAPYLWVLICGFSSKSFEISKCINRAQSQTDIVQIRSFLYGFFCNADSFFLFFLSFSFLQREAMSQHFPQFIAIELCKKYVYFQKILVAELRKMQKIK